MALCAAPGCKQRINHKRTDALYCSSSCERESLRQEERAEAFWAKYRLVHRTEPALRWEPASDSHNAA